MARNLAQEDAGSIIDHLSDVIEGGNAYNGGTSFNGIAGLYSNDEKTRNGLSIAASSAGTTSTIPYASGSWPADEWVKASTPKFFAVATSGNNTGYARPISNWNNTTKVFTVAPAFTYSVASGVTFSVQQGFRRYPEGLDFDASGHEAQTGFDRMYLWDVLGEGAEVPMYGQGVATFSATLRLRLRLLKYGRESIRVKQSALANMAILRRGLLAPGNRSDDVYVRAVLPSGGSAIEDLPQRLVVRQDFTVIYRVETTL